MLKLNCYIACAKDFNHFYYIIYLKLCKYYKAATFSYVKHFFIQFTIMINKVLNHIQQISRDYLQKVSKNNIQQFL